MFKEGIYQFTLLEEGVETTRNGVELLSTDGPLLRCWVDGREVIYNATAATFIKAVRTGDPGGGGFQSQVMPSQRPG